MTENKSIEFPNGHEPMEKMFIKMLGVMRPFIADLSSDCHNPDDYPAYLRPAMLPLEQLRRDGFVAVRELSAAFEQAVIRGDEDVSEAVAVFCRFLVNQAQVRASVLSEVCKELPKHPLWEMDACLSSHANRLGELGYLLAECCEKGWEMEEKFINVRISAGID